MLQRGEGRLWGKVKYLINIAGKKSFEVEKNLKSGLCS